MRHFRFLLKHWGLLTILLVVGIVASLMESLGVALVFPLFQGLGGMGEAVIPFPFDQLANLFKGLDLVKRLQIVAVLLVAITAVKELMLVIKNICSMRIKIIISRHFMTECFDQLMRVGMGYFNSQKYGDMHTLVGVYANNIGTSMSRFAEQIHMPFTILILVTMLLFLSWKVTLLSVLLGAVMIFAVRGLMNRVDKIGRKIAPATSMLNSTLLDMIVGMKVIRLFNREGQAKSKYISTLDNYNDVVYQFGKLRSFVNPITELIGVAIMSVFMVVSSFMLLKQPGYGLEMLLVFYLAFNRIKEPINAINQNRVAFVGDLPYYHEVFRFLDGGNKRYLKNGKIAFKGLRQTIELREVKFGYDTDKPIVLQGVSFTVSKGAKFGVVGPSGAGKSTLTELLLRFYDPQAGGIFVDGIELKDLDLNSWRRHIGVVSQDIFLFNDTVRHNISFAGPEATQQEIEDAARKAHAHEFIKALPQGYDTLIGERGVMLSGGQRQRIAIARAILTDPEILVFDEATSSLDSESEKLVQKTLDEVGEGKTVITIAHRLSTVFDSDKIIVIERGCIVEQGAHQELVRQQGLYSRLIRMQGLVSSKSEVQA